MIDKLKKLHANENGAEAGLERILLVAFIALPLLGLMIYFRNQIADKAKEWWETVFGAGEEGGQYINP